MVGLSGADYKKYKTILQAKRRIAETAMVVQGYQSGKTTYQLAGEFDCHHQTISNILKRHNIKVDKCKAQKKLNADVVVAMYYLREKY